MADLCLGCGDDISAARGKRQLQTDASKHVLPLITHVLNEELKKLGYQDDEFCNRLIRDCGRVCRKCFSTYERCNKLLNGIRENARNAISVILNDSSANACISDLRGEPTPKKSRLSMHYGASSSSPDVVVSLYECVGNVFTINFDAD